MTWAEVAARLAGARTSWLGTVTPSGAPHAAPVWGTVHDGTLYLYSERRTAKARNLAANPRVVVHLGSGEDVLIVHGTVADLGVPGAVGAMLAHAPARPASASSMSSLISGSPTGSIGRSLSSRAKSVSQIPPIARKAATSRTWTRSAAVAS